MNRFGLSRFSCQGLFSTRGALARKRWQTRLQPVQLHGPIKDIKNNCSCDIARPAHISEEMKVLPSGRRAPAGERPNFWDL